jgi:putative membrane protein
MDGDWRVWWPTFHAVLNGTTAVLLMAGRYFVRRGRIRAHRWCMHTAFGLSVLFFGSYLIYHSLVGTTRFGRGGWLRTLYLTVLATHTALAVAVVPLAVVVLVRGLRRQWPRHRALARWAWPIWLYVAVTGVLIYFMLYRL